VIAAERGDHGELVKSLGDGALLVYRDPCEAVAAGARIIAAMTGPPKIHAGVHRGIAIARAGDYLGSAVNLAARLLAVSGPDELVATATVVESCDAFDWEPAGEADLRGVATPVGVFRLASTQ
jgi:adenylate cyclase